MIRIAVAVIFLAFIWSGVDALTDYQRQQINQYLESAKMVEDQSLFDGKAFNPAADLNQATEYYNRFVDATNRAVNQWNKLSSSDQGSADGQVMFGQLKSKLDWAQAMQAAYPAFRASKSGESSTSTATEEQEEQSSGGMTDYQKEQLTQYLDSNRMRKDTGLFDGNDFVAGAPFAAIQQYYQGYIASFDNAANAWERQISTTAKATPDGKNLHKRLLDAKSWGDAMSAKYPQVEAQHMAQQEANEAAAQQAEAQAATDKEAHRQQCVDFQARAMTPLNRDPMTRLINQLLHGNAGIGSPEGVQEHYRISQEVLGVCKSVDYQTLTATPCWYVLNRPDYDPVNWCNAANDAVDLIRAAAINSARQSISVVGSSTIQSIDEFTQRDGWLTLEGPVTFNDNLYFSHHGRENWMDNVNALMQSVGVDNAEDLLFAEQKGRLDTLRAEVERTALSWPLPANEADNYSTAFAREQTREWHPDADVKTAFLSRATWKIHRNELGVILRRTLPGYVVFKLPDDPFCQLRSYTLTEDYLGAGQYQQAAGVRFGYVRFQNCP